jgi:hypothetical protein
MKKVPKKSKSPRKILIFALIFLVLFAILIFIFRDLYKNTFFAEKKFEEIARRYYEDEFYESILLENKNEAKDDVFDKYKNGIRIKLRQVLNRELVENNANYRSFFENEAFSCDTNQSFAKITPHAPFEKSDYEIEIKLLCNKN